MLTCIKRFNEIVWCFFHQKYRSIRWFCFQKIVNSNWNRWIVFFIFILQKSKKKYNFFLKIQFKTFLNNSLNVERFFLIVRMFVFTQKFFTFDVFFIENINFALISFSKTIINNKSIENQKCFFHCHFAEIKWKV